MTATLEGGEWSAARPGLTLPPGNSRYPFYRRLGGPQGRSGRAVNFVPTGIRSRTVQPVVSRYTYWATGPTITCITVVSNIKICNNKPPQSPVLICFYACAGCVPTSVSLHRIWKYPVQIWRAKFAVWCAEIHFLIQPCLIVNTFAAY